MYGLELNHIVNAEWRFPIKYNIHRLGKDGKIILLGRDLQSISENQQRFVKAQIAVEESIEEKRVGLGLDKSYFRNIQMFHIDRLTINMTKHNLVPKHIKINTEKEQNLLLNKMDITKNMMP